jgi:hypothetical protein
MVERQVSWIVRKHSNFALVALGLPHSPASVASEIGCVNRIDAFNNQGEKGEICD